MDVPLSKIAERIVEVVTAFHGSESQNEPSHRSSTCRHTQWWRRSSKTLSLPQQVESAQDAKIVSRQDPSVNQGTSRQLSGGEAVRDHQEHRVEKESDHP